MFPWHHLGEQLHKVPYLVAVRSEEVRAILGNHDPLLINVIIAIASNVITLLQYNYFLVEDLRVQVCNSGT